MMGEVVARRFARLTPATADGYDEGFATVPNLVVVDGGKGQLSAALEAMHAYDLPRVAVVSLAKRAEEVFVPGHPAAGRCSIRRRPGFSSSSGSGTRRTGSRSAFTEHGGRRARRSRSSTRSRESARRGKRALIGHFGSPERLLAATRDELEGVPGVPARTGRRIYAALHKTGRA